MSDAPGLFSLTVEGAPATFWVTYVHGLEALSAPFAFELTCYPSQDDGSAVDGKLVEAIATKPAKITLQLEDGERTIEGIVDAVVAAESSWIVRVVPRLGALADAINHRVFVEKDAIAIAKQVLEAHGFEVRVACTGKPLARSQCVQAFESELDFVHRVLAEEGIVWFLDTDKPDAIVLCDDPQNFADAPGAPLPVQETGGLVSETSVFSVRLARRVVPDKVSLRDYDFEKPMSVASLRVDAKVGEGRLERFEYRGHYTTTEAGRALAKIRLDQFRANETTLHAETTARYLKPGEIVTLEGGPIAAIAGRWLVLEVEHTCHELDAEVSDHRYVCRFRAVPAATNYRSMRPKAPKFGGIETVDITGPGGAEIHPDKYGRVRHRFRWEREHPLDDTASFWSRVVQPPTSGGFFLPRTGWEQISGFWGSSGDTPVLLGRLYTGVAPPPAGLPGKKVVSTFGTQTTPGGGGGNFVTMDDSAGNEAMAFHASKDFNEKTENDKVVQVTADDAHTISGDRKVIVGKVYGLSVGGAQTHAVSGDRKVNVDANSALKAGDETVVIGAARIFDVGGDCTTQCANLARVVGGLKGEACVEQLSRLVTGASAVVIGASFEEVGGISSSVSVGGLSREEVGGAKNIKARSYGVAVSGTFTESYASRTVTTRKDVVDQFVGAVTYDVTGAATFKGEDVIVTATDKITIKAGGMTVTMTTSEVTIDGKYDSSQASLDKSSEDYD